MKKLIILFLSLLALVFIVSCSKDDNNSNDNPSPAIEGKWQISKEGETLTTLAPAENEGNCGLTVIEILQGGVSKATGFEYIDSICIPVNLEGTWTKKDNTLTVTSSGITIAFEILELTQSTLTLQSTDSNGTTIQVFKRI